MFGLGSLPAGRAGRPVGPARSMMIIFFFGMGVAALLTALTQNAWQLAAALTLIGAFAAIYHPVGIPMLVQNAPTPGAVIGVNGLAGNLGIAVAALVTGFLVSGSAGARRLWCPGWFASRAASCSRRLARRKPKPPAEAQAARPRSRCRPRCWRASSRS